MPYPQATLADPARAWLDHLSLTLSSWLWNTLVNFERDRYQALGKWSSGLEARYKQASSSSLVISQFQPQTYMYIRPYVGRAQALSFSPLTLEIPPNAYELLRSSLPDCSPMVRPKRTLDLPCWRPGFLIQSWHEWLAWANETTWQPWMRLQSHALMDGLARGEKRAVFTLQRRGNVGILQQSSKLIILDVSTRAVPSGRRNVTTMKHKFTWEFCSWFNMNRMKVVNAAKTAAMQQLCGH